MKLLILIFSLSFLFLAHNTYAVNWCAGCKIKSIFVGPHPDKSCNTESCALIRVTGNLGRAACSTGINWQYVLDTSTNTGQLLYSQLLTAYAADLTLDMIGDNTCSIADGAENLGGAYFPF
jgi:hypothetical protein